MLRPVSLKLEPIFSRLDREVGSNMDDASSQSPRDMIAEIVGRILKSKGVSNIAVDDNLRDAGLSSLELVNVMLAVEDTFDLTFPQEKLVPDNFRSIAAIEALVTEML
jgi:acyl carrier protein